MLIKKTIFTLILLSISIFADDLSTALQGNSERKNYNFTDISLETIAKNINREDSIVIDYTYSDNFTNMSLIEKWIVDATIAHHINAIDNNKANDICLNCAANREFGINGKIQYFTNKSFAIGVKATILKNQNRYSYNTPLTLNSIGIVGTFIL